VTAEVVLSELGDISRFRNAKAVCAYAGLVPVVRQSGERKSKDLKITKEGSGLLRWALVEAAWRLVGNSPKWAALFSRLMHRSGKKRAIVAVARKLLCVLYALLRTSTPYKIVTTQTAAPPDNWQEVGQDIDSGPDHNHGDDGSPDNWQEVGQDIDSGPDHNHGDDGSPDNWQEVARDIDSGPDHNHGGDGSSDNSQEIAQDVDSGPDRNHVTGRTVPEQE